MDQMKHRRLQELDRSDFEVVDGEPDIRGWDVKNSGGQKIGEVEDLIVDAKQKKVRYMVVDMDDNELKLDHHKVLIPIGLAELDEEEDDVLLPQVGIEQLRALPGYDPDHLDEEAERRIFSIFDRRAVERGSEDRELYTHDYYKDENLYRHRTQRAQPVAHNREESEYERGLRLWERRSQGGILPGDPAERRGMNQPVSSDYERERGMDESTRMERVRSRRAAYEQRRWRDADERSRHRKSNSIERRIRDEGLQDADD